MKIAPVFDGEHIGTSAPVIRSITDSETPVAAGPKMPLTSALSSPSTAVVAIAASVPSSTIIRVIVSPAAAISSAAISTGLTRASTMPDRPPVCGAR